MSAKTISLRIEALLCKVNQSMFHKSDEILQKPYDVIVSALEHRVPQEKLDKFKLYYQAIGAKTLQELVDSNYDVEQLTKDLKDMIENK